MRLVYLDGNATTPPHPDVVAAMSPYLTEHWGNPSSKHAKGVAAREALDHARDVIAHALGADESEIVLTGSGTEADVLGVMGCARAHRLATGKDMLVATTVEHPAVLGALKVLENEGFTLRLVDVGADGRPDPAAFAQAIDDRTALACCMLANNESGAVLPVAEIARAAHAKGVSVMCDAVNACGKWRVHAAELGVDLLAISGHKFHGPRGIGVLVVRKGTPLVPVIPGGGQERGRRGGTENVASAVGLAKALDLATATLDVSIANLRARARELLDGLRRLEPTLVLNSPQIEAHRLPNTLHVSFPARSGADLARELDQRGVCVSTGAACHDGGTGSPVLTAMGLDLARQRGGVRLSLLRTATREDVEHALVAFAGAMGVVSARA